MKTKTKHKKTGFFERFANWATHFTGSSAAFIGAVAIVLGWAVSGPVFDYSETWQLVINTGTTIITFLMVFLIQKAQNKDSKALHLKLNELLAAQNGASNRMVDLENMNEEELDQLHKFYAHLAELAKKDTDLLCSHSIDAAQEINTAKLSGLPATHKRKPNDRANGSAAKTTNGTASARTQSSASKTTGTKSGVSRQKNT